MTFDPVRTRVQMFEPEMLKFCLDYDYASHPFPGNAVAHQVDVVVAAWLVGLHVEISPVIRESNIWIDRAIETGEDEHFGTDPNAHRVTLNSAKAVLNWLETGTNDKSSWNFSRKCEEARWSFEKQPWTTKEIRQYGLDDYMAFCYQCGEHEAAINMYEKWREIKTPFTLSKAAKPNDFVYALCLNAAGLRSFEEEDLLKAGRKILRLNLQDNWLGRGLFTTAAIWLKIVYWDRGNKLNPLEVILRAYEDMPKVPRPEFVHGD